MREEVFALPRNGPIAQRLEQGTHNPLVPGSNPGGPTLRAVVALRNRARAGFERAKSIVAVVQKPTKIVVLPRNPLTTQGRLSIMPRVEKIHPAKAPVVDRRRIVKRGQ